MERPSTTAFVRAHELHRAQLKSKSDATAPPFIRPDINKPAALPSLGITKIRLDSPEPGEQENSAVLKFQMSNESSSTLTDIVFEVTIMLPGDAEGQFNLFRSVCTEIKRLVDQVQRSILDAEYREHGVTVPKAIDNAIVNYVRIESKGAIEPE